jgi:hypothetical protein
MKGIDDGDDPAMLFIEDRNAEAIDIIPDNV